MQPDFRIHADRVEITAAIRDRLIELSITDEAGIQSDEIKLTLDDRRREDGAIAQLPKIGTVLSVAIGYAETALTPMGSFVVDEIEISSPPATLTVSAKAADMVGPFRSPKTRSWDATTLGELVKTLAAEHKYTPKVDAALGAIAIPHIDQTAESDMAFLTRIASGHDATAKPADGFLVLAKRGTAKSATGKTLPTITLNLKQLTHWRYRHSAREPGGSGKSESDAQAPPKAEGGVRAYWWDTSAGERKEVTAGKPPFTEIRHVHGTAAEAKAAVTARKNAGERGQGELNLTLPGDARFFAEARLSIALRPGIPADWRIKRVAHQLSNQGFTTQVDCERFTATPEPITNNN